MRPGKAQIFSDAETIRRCKHPIALMNGAGEYGLLRRLRERRRPAMRPRRDTGSAARRRHCAPGLVQFTVADEHGDHCRGCGAGAYSDALMNPSEQFLRAIVLLDDTRAGKADDRATVSGQPVIIGPMLANDAAGSAGRRIGQEHDV